MEFTAKTAGKQIGTVARVAFADGRVVSYFVKSHRTIQISGDSFAHISVDRTRYVDYKELFVYRVLANLGMGPEAEFIVPADDADPFISEEANLLIATLEVSQSTPTGRTAKFIPCVSHLDNMLRDLCDAGLAGDARDARLEDALYALFSNSITRRDLKRIDLLSRILHLNDVLVNLGNFGQLVSTDHTAEEVGWRVVDFTVGLGRRGLCRSADRYVETHIKRDFEEVNGTLRYDDNPALRRILLEDVRLGEQLNEELLDESDGVPRLLGVLQAAERDVLQFLEDNREALRMKDDIHARKVADLRAFMEAAFRNLQAL